MPKTNWRDKLGYEKPSKDVMDRRAKQGGGNREWFIKSEVKTFTPQEGKKGNNIRLCPPTWKKVKGVDRYWGYELWIHFNVGTDNAAFLCPQAMKFGDKRCPICEERARAGKGKADEEYIKQLAPTKRVAMYIIDRNNEDEGPLLWNAPYSVDKDIAKHSISKKTGELRALDDPEEGFDIFFEREGTGKNNTRYSGFEVDSETNALKPKWLEYVLDNPIPDCLVYSDYDHIKEVFTAGDSSEEEEEDEDAGRKRLKKGSKYEKSEDDEDEEDEDEKSSKKPAKKPAKKPSKVDDDDDEEEAEEDEKPSWEEVHAMKRRKLEQLALDKTDIEIEDEEDTDDEDLADKICKELGVKKPKKEEKKSKASSARERLKNLRKSEDDEDEEDDD